MSFVAQRTGSSQFSPSPSNGWYTSSCIAHVIVQIEQFNGTVRAGTCPAACDTWQYRIAQNSNVQYSTGEYNIITVQYKQHSTALYSNVQRSAVQCHSVTDHDDEGYAPHDDGLRGAHGPAVARGRKTEHRAPHLPQVPAGAPGQGPPSPPTESQFFRNCPRSCPTSPGAPPGSSCTAPQSPLRPRTSCPGSSIEYGAPPREQGSPRPRSRGSGPAWQRRKGDVSRAALKCAVLYSTVMSCTGGSEKSVHIQYILQRYTIL